MIKKTEMEQAKREQNNGTRYMEQDNETTTEAEKIKHLSDLLKEMSADKSILSEFFKTKWRFFWQSYYINRKVQY